MISVLHDSPENVAAFYTLGKTTKEEFENLVIPHVQKKVLQHKQFNYMLYFNHSCENCDLELLLRDSISSLQDISVLNRFAIVSNYSNEQIYRQFFRSIPEFDIRIFTKNNIYNALYWCHNGRTA